MKNKETKNSNKNSKSQLKDYAKYSSIGFEMVIVILGAVFGGIKLDEWVSGMGFPLFTLVLSLVGIGLAIYIGIKDFLKIK